jgi:hypothetical protein
MGDSCRDYSEREENLMKTCSQKEKILKLLEKIDLLTRKENISENAYEFN